MPSDNWKPDSQIYTTCKLCRKTFYYYDDECKCDPLCSYKTQCDLCNAKLLIKKDEEKERIDKFVREFTNGR